MDEMTNRDLRGGCACGGVRFELDGPMRGVIACHCETCRRTSGHYWAATEAYRRDLRLIADDTLTWFASSDSAQRGFCAACGSSLFYRRNQSDCISIAAGALDLPTGLRCVEDICTSEAGDYYGLDGERSQQAGNVISPAWRFPGG